MIATAPHHDSIALRAYLTWEGEGRPHGRHEDHWFAAEASLTRAAEPKAAPAKGAATLAKSAPAKVAVAKKPAPAKKASPKAPAETVVAAAALAAPRGARAAAKTANGTH